MPPKQKKAFTLIELLVVISIIALLVSIMVPALARARESAKVTAVNFELYHVAMALEMYMEDNSNAAQSHPPTFEDCQGGSVKDHLYQMPTQLTGRYLPKKSSSNSPESTVIEDRFNPYHTYKYMGVGQHIIDRGFIDKWSNSGLWVPDGFPHISSIDSDKGQKYSMPKQSPVTWAIFSIGPKFDEKKMKANNFPIPTETWYSPAERSGLIIRVRLKNGQYAGTFQ